MVTLTERSFATDTQSGIGTAYKTTTTVNGTLVSTSFRSADGMSSKTVTLAGTSTTVNSIPANGAWTLTTTTPDGQSSVQTYTDGRLAKTETFDNSATPVSIASTSYGYDTLGRTSSTTDSRTGVTTTAYLSTTADVPTNVTDPGSRTTAYTYDTRGRTITIDAPDTTDKDGNTIDNITHTSYYSNGQVAGTWGDQTYARFNVYDSQNRLIELRTYQDLAHGTEPTASTTGFASTKWNYNPTRGWLDNKRYDDNKGTDYTYTSAGRLETREWSRLNTSNVKLKTTYSYDQGQMVSTTYNDGLTQGVVYTYDNFGRPTVVTQGTGATANQHAYIYDAATLVLDKEIISYGNGLSRTLDRSQDGLLRPAGFQLMNGTTEEHATSYGYDAVGRLAGVHTAATYSATPDFSYAYLANSGSLLETVTGPAHTVTNTYETNRNVLTNKENKAGVNIRSNFAYTVNDLGQRDDISRSGTAFASANTETWNYNAVGETVSADHSTNNAFDRSFLFDGIGNRKKSADSLTLPATDNYTSNALNQYSAVGVAARAFDDDGNLTDDGTKQFVWDGENRLIEVKNAGGTIATYAYDYQSRRITKTVGSTITNFVYNGWNQIAEFSGTALSKSYVWGMDLSGSMQGAGGVGGLLAVNDTVATYFPIMDGNGNVSEYVDTTGTVVAHYEYDAFGQAVASGTKADDFSHQFSTKQRDTETDLHYYGYRYYDSANGRWLGRDPIEENGGLNIYNFVNNDGVNSSDYLGMDPNADYWSFSDEEKAKFNKFRLRGISYVDSIDKVMRNREEGVEIIPSTDEFGNRKGGCKCGSLSVRKAITPNGGGLEPSQLLGVNDDNRNPWISLSDSYKNPTILKGRSHVLWDVKVTGSTCASTTVQLEETMTPDDLIRKFKNSTYGSNIDTSRWYDSKIMGLKNTTQFEWNNRTGSPFANASIYKEPYNEKNKWSGGNKRTWSRVTVSGKNKEGKTCCTKLYWVR